MIAEKKSKGIVIVWYSKQSRGKEIILLLAAIKIEFS